MKLADVIGAMQLSAYAEVALVIAAAGFVTVLVTVFLKRNREPFARASRIPLEDAPSIPTGQETTHD